MKPRCGTSGLLVLDRISGEAMSREKINDLFLEYYNDLKSYAVAVLKNEQSAEDVVMDTFKTVCKMGQEENVDIGAVANPRAWLRKILRNAIRNSKKINNRRAMRELSIEAFEEDVLSSNPELLDLRTKYAGIINDEDLELVIYIATTKATYADAAQHFELKSAEACRKRYKQALKEIHKKLTK